jgi:hypothetical protein
VRRGGAYQGLWGFSPQVLSEKGHRFFRRRTRQQEYSTLLRPTWPFQPASLQRVLGVLYQYRSDSLLTMNNVMADATKSTKAHSILSLNYLLLALAVYRVSRTRRRPMNQRLIEMNVLGFRYSMCAWTQLLH